MHENKRTSKIAVSLLGATVGLIYGVIIISLLHSLFMKIDTVISFETLAEKESLEAKLRLSLVVLCVILGACVPLFFRNVIFNKRLRFIAYGSVLGALFAVAATLIIARYSNVYPFVGKSSQSVIFWGRALGIPLGILAGGFLGFIISRRRQVNKNV